MIEYLAKSSGEPLKEHSIKLMFLCYDIMKKELAVDKAKGGEDIIRCGLIASLFHDIGKTSCKFQNYLKGIDTQSPGHSIVGGYLFDIIVSNSTFDDNIKKDIVKDIIMLHMKDPLYDDKYLYDYYSVDDVKSVVNYIEDVIEIFENEFEQVEGYRLNLNIYFNEIDEDELDIKLPSEIKKFSHSSKLEENRVRYIENKIYYEGIFNMLFDVVRWYDVYVSSDEAPFDVKDHKRYDIAVKKPSSYEVERWLKQVACAKQILNNTEKNIFSIKADTGFGKTLIAILTTIYSGGYSYFVLPTNQLAKSIYKSIKKCLEDLGLESEISVALLLGGEWKAGSDTKEKSNIIVTNIDNFEINTFRNKRKRIAIQHLNRTCIFDEFHSYMCNAPLMFSFASTIRERLMCKNIKTVLMSATPIYDRCFVKEDDVEQININDDNFANRQIRFTFNTSKEDAIKKYYGGTLVDKDVLVVACTILSADFIHEIVNDMLHSRFTESDKKEKLENLLTYKGKENRVNYSLSSTNNMIGQGVDCSFDYGTIIENVEPESNIQAMGRNNRYTHNGIRDCHLCLDSDKNRIFRFTKTEWKRIYGWNNFLKSKVGDGGIITSKELNDLRNEFNGSDEFGIKNYIRELIVESYNQYIQIEFTEGYDIKNGDDNESTAIITSGKMTMRGETDTIYCIFRDVYGNMTEELSMPSSDFTSDNIINDAINYIGKDKELIKKYFSNKYRFENNNNKKNHLLEKARSSETPLPVLCEWTYNKKRGVHKK